MKHYEIVCMIHPDKIDSIEKIIEQYTKIINFNNGTIHRVEDWGRRQLAYPIANLHKAHYLLINFSGNTKTLNDLNENFKYNNAVLRRLVIKTKNSITKPSVIMHINEKKIEGYKNEK